jgi:hypothetical protein
MFWPDMEQRERMTWKLFNIVKGYHAGEELVIVAGCQL